MGLPDVAEALHQDALSLPPLMYGEAVEGAPLAHSVARAKEGCDAGLVAYRLLRDRAEAAMVFAPEVSLGEAMVMLPLCGVAFQNALGALSPPEVAVHLEWSGAIRVNGARCGGFRAVASHADADTMPDWLVIGLEMPLWPAGDAAPGDTPNETTLYAEGCADIAPALLVEAWARHTLNWLGRWEDEGTKPLHDAWCGLAHGIGARIDEGPYKGGFVGVDSRFGLLLKTDETTRLHPLTDVLETS